MSDIEAISIIKSTIAKLADGNDLTANEAEQTFNVIMDGNADAAQIGGILMALRIKGETIDEITGAVQAMRAKMLPVQAPKNAIDIVGTGGDGIGTYNISTATAIVTAACGVKVAKHGNKAVSSKSGAADVLNSLGVKIDITADKASQVIQNAGVGFIFAPNHHSAMRHVAGTRAALGVRTIFNILGPLSNPAGVTRQIVGVYSKHWLKPIANVLSKLGSKHVWVVHGSDGMDEITTTGPTDIVELKDGIVNQFTIEPDKLGIPISHTSDLKGGDSKYNAQALKTLLEGKMGAYRDIVLLNSAAALIVAGKALNLEEGINIAANAIDKGNAMQTLEQLITLTNT